MCPFCGYYSPPAERSGPEFVDGDLTELNGEALAALRNSVEEIDKDPELYRSELAGKRAPWVGQMAHVKRHVAKQGAQAELRDAIALWACYQRANGRSDSESYRRFYYLFGVDVLSAQALGTKEAKEIEKNIRKDLR